MNQKRNSILKNLSFFIAITAICISCSTIYPVTATNNEIGPKKGTSSTAVLFGAVTPQNLGTGILTNRNFGVLDAVQNGGIDTIATVDLKVTNFVFFQRAELIIYGN